MKEDTGYVDYDMMEEVALRERPKLIIGGASAYSREWDYARMRKIADEIGAIFMVDMAHPAHSRRIVGQSFEIRSHRHLDHT